MTTRMKKTTMKMTTMSPPRWVAAAKKKKQKKEIKMKMTIGGAFWMAAFHRWIPLRALPLSQKP
jgi:hypothetical protein